jgi:hypothetical protein
MNSAPPGWIEVKLGEICDPVNGRVFNSTH